MTPQIMFGNVMHKRLFPKVNAFSYGIYYLCLPLSKIYALRSSWRFGVDKFALCAFYRRDHGDRKGGDLELWARSLLEKSGVAADGEIMLLTMPRIFGHVFNPISFWFCHDKGGALRAVICEVNNTFGESHSYICRSSSEEQITGDMWLQAEKVFHVSPFLEREGKYRFRFALKDENVGIWIDYDDAQGNKKLLTALTGGLVALGPSSLRRAFWRYPLVSLIALARIHWHAVRLLVKGIKYVPKPLQNKETTSISADITQL